ncbi:MAG: hydroxyacid dehydrogenase [Marinovum algicola]|jgi:phosphoglycerate dehydrogenase-like enzyme|uniref:Phosphoglycerate dehydrogenase n=1 Tax=Marinovum algicola TaxID=42444 RepID=A0A975WFM2_9RHOB|nr:hydroxyacid dehydrogenase [Marinovum algicola]SEK11522.1 Phosphoglycerate dehydrogenase [Marinovum algicola]SLN76365.1 D-3-phosphoglycerate dehydrogenase [Marinovum algicola]
MTKQASPAFDTRPRVAVLMPAEVRSRIFPQQAEGALNAFAHPVFVSDEDLVSGALANALRDVTAVITGWLSPTLSHLLAPQGDIVFVSHAAGSVKRLDVEQALVDGHIRVSHSAPEIALAVAEFTLAQILAHLRLHTRQDAGLRGTMGWAEMRKGYLGQLLAAQTVGLVGLGYVGRLVLDRLRPFGCKVAVYDPFISTEEAERLGVTLMELDTLFASCPVVSLHAANLPATEGMITRSHLHAMVDGSLLVNTARAGLLETGALVEELQQGRIFAAIDTFEVEPLPDDDPLRRMPNVYLSPHCAGHTRESYVRQGLSAVEEVRRFFAGEPLNQEIRREKAAALA